MVEGVKEQALDMNMVDNESWQKGINDLYKTTESDGVFFFTTFLKASELNNTHESIKFLFFITARNRMS